MINRNRLTGGLLIAAMLIMAAGTTFAQMPWNPPCPTLSIINTAPCAATLRFVTTPPGVLPAFTIPAGGAAAFPTPPVPFTINGIISLGGVFYPFNAPPPVAACNCLPGDWSICCVTLGPAPGCCFDICGTNTNPPCRITLRPSLCPVALCRP